MLSIWRRLKKSLCIKNHLITKKHHDLAISGILLVVLLSYLTLLYNRHKGISDLSHTLKCFTTLYSAKERKLFQLALKDLGKSSLLEFSLQIAWCFLWKKEFYGD